MSRMSSGHGAFLVELIVAITRCPEGALHAAAAGITSAGVQMLDRLVDGDVLLAPSAGYTTRREAKDQVRRRHVRLPLPGHRLGQRRVRPPSPRF